MNKSGDTIKTQYRIMGEKSARELGGEDGCIEVSGARVHNLKDIDVLIPRGKLSVITGLSGSGKSSLAFDTIFAEGQRRYIETFSAYARNFLGNLERPDVDEITGLSPVISIEQKTTNKNPRSQSAPRRRFTITCVCCSQGQVWLIPM